MKTPLALLVAGILVTQPAGAAEISAQKMWRGPAKMAPDAMLRCRVALEQDRLDESFLQAQWQAVERPRIEWEKEISVVIAPQMYLEEHRLILLNIDQEPSQIVVTWALSPGGHGVAPESRKTSNVTTHASTAIGPEIIVLALPREAVGTRKIICRGPRLEGAKE